MDLPDGLVESRRTPLFDINSVPKGLLNKHLTKTWAKLFVEQGSVIFVDEISQETTVVSNNSSHVITPDIYHHIEPDNEAIFYVVFYGENVEVKISKKDE